jgi:hypothetical protein
MNPSYDPSFINPYRSFINPLVDKPGLKKPLFDRLFTNESGVISGSMYICFVRIVTLCSKLYEI